MWVIYVDTLCCDSSEEIIIIDLLILHLPKVTSNPTLIRAWKPWCCCWKFWKVYCWNKTYGDVMTWALFASTHWGRVTHICVSKLTIIGWHNGLSPDRRQAIIWTNAGILLIGPLWTNFSEILIEILTFSFKNMRLKVSSARRRPFCLGLNVLMTRCSLQSAMMWIFGSFMLSWISCRRIDTIKSHVTSL